VDASSHLPGVDQLAADIVLAVHRALADRPIGERFDVGDLVDEAVLFRLARGEIEKALPATLETVAARVREDLYSGS
jgi:hypothetical protein